MRRFALLFAALSLALLVFAALMLLLIVILILPIGRRLAINRVVPLLKRAWAGAEQVAHQPSKIGLLVGGSAIVTMSYATALYISVLAFGGGIGFAAVVALYLTGGAVASAAPTPGGLGAVEAVLIAGLVGLGLDNEVAVPAVFLFRLATFWLPTIPGWFAFHSLTKREFL